MATKQVSDRAALIRELTDAGLPKDQAAAQADKIIGERDRVEVGRDGKERPAPVGPVL